MELLNFWAITTPTSSAFAMMTHRAFRRTGKLWQGTEDRLPFEGKQDSILLLLPEVNTTVFQVLSQPSCSRPRKPHWALCVQCWRMAPQFLKQDQEPVWYNSSKRPLQSTEDYLPRPHCSLQEALVSFYWGKWRVNGWREGQRSALFRNIYLSVSWNLVHPVGQQWDL